MIPCQDCRCGRGQGRGCKLRPPRDLKPWEVWLLRGLMLACLLVVVASHYLGGTP